MLTSEFVTRRGYDFIFALNLSCLCFSSPPSSFSFLVVSSRSLSRVHVSWRSDISWLLPLLSLLLQTTQMEVSLVAPAEITVHCWYSNSLTHLLRRQNEHCVFDAPSVVHWKVALHQRGFLLWAKRYISPEQFYEEYQQNALTARLQMQRTAWRRQLDKIKMSRCSLSQVALLKMWGPW